MDKFPEIPGYIIKKKIGQGGMASVYLGLQENLKREVAVKILDTEILRDHNFPKRFLREAETAANLHHQGIITIYDVGQIDNLYYISMEYLQESLKDKLKNITGSKLPPTQALHIATEIAKAVDHAHSHGVVHRDIKPDNILFRQDGTVVLADFGIAKALESESRLTTTGMSVGTPHYMSPEQMSGMPVDGRADLYSLGIVLVEMLTGDVPYKATDPVAIGIKHIRDPIPTLPESLQRFQPLIDGLLEKEPEKRIQSGAAFIDRAARLTSEYNMEGSSAYDEKTEVFLRQNEIALKKKRFAVWPIAVVSVAIAVALFWFFTQGPLKRKQTTDYPANPSQVEPPGPGLSASAPDGKAGQKRDIHKQDSGGHLSAPAKGKHGISEANTPTGEKTTTEQAASRPSPTQTGKPMMANDFRKAAMTHMQNGDLHGASEVWSRELQQKKARYGILLRKDLSSMEVFNMMQRIKRRGLKANLYVLRQKENSVYYAVFVGHFREKPQAQEALRRMAFRTAQSRRPMPDPVVVDLKNFLP